MGGVLLKTFGWAIRNEDYGFNSESAVHNFKDDKNKQNHVNYSKHGKWVGNIKTILVSTSSKFVVFARGVDFCKPCCKGA